MEPARIPPAAYGRGADADAAADGAVDRVRQRIVCALLALGAVCTAGLWAFERATGLLAEIDRYAYPGLLTLFTGSLAAIAWVPRWRSRAELLVFVGVSAYFVAVLFHFMVENGDHRFYAIASTLQWLPLMYLLAFVTFPRRRAFRVASALFLASLAASLAARLLRGGSAWEMPIGALLGSAYVVQALVVFILFFFTMLLQQLEDARQRARALEHVAYTDSLTGIANRRGLDLRLDALARRPDRCVGLILIDIDHFKSVNDRFGHQAGDALLVFLARRIAREVRGSDWLARWGGEEFLVAVPAQPEDGGAADAVTVASDTRRLAERIRHAVAAGTHPTLGGATLSAGVTVWTAGEALQTAMRRADEALYAAKAGGRDRVEVCWAVSPADRAGHRTNP